MPKSTTVVFSWPMAGVYTRPLSATCWLASAASGAPVVPAPLETKSTLAMPANVPALAVFIDSASALLLAPAFSPVIAPLPTKPGATLPNEPFRRSVKASGEVLVTPTDALGFVSPTRATRSTLGVLSVGLARRYTLPLTLTFCVPMPSWQFGAQLPTLLASETNETVAVPFLAPAVPVCMPTTMLLLLVAPGASRLKLPLAVIGAAALTVAFSAACGATVATLLMLTACVGEAAPTRTLPRLMTALLISGEAWLMTLATAWMMPATPNDDEPTPNSPNPLLTPLTAPALK